MSESTFDRTRSEPELRARIAGGSLDADDYLELAELLKDASRFHEAVQVYEQALSLGLEHVDKARVAWELGSLLETSMGQRASPRMMAHLALSLLSEQPESGNVLLLRGLSQSLLAHSVWFEDADAGIRTAHLGVESLQRVIRQYSDDPAMGVAHYELARLYNALGDPESAIGACREYLRSEPDRRSRLAALSVLAEALELAGRLPEAEIAVREGLSCVENDKGMLPNLYLTLALIKKAENQPSEAVRNLEEALKALRELDAALRDPEMMSVILWHLAELHSEMGNQRAAAATLTQILNHYPDDSSDRRRAQLWLGDSHANSGMLEEARKYYEQVLTSPQASDEDRAAARDGLAELP